MSNPSLRQASRRLQELLRQARKDAGLTQAEVAKRMKLPQSFVSKYESGEGRLDLIELRYICEALGVELVKFLERFEKAAGKQHHSNRLDGVA